MVRYVDVSKIISSLPETIEDELNLMVDFKHSDIKIELPICSSYDELIETGKTKTIQSCTTLYNCPESHFLSFDGVNTNIGLYTVSGVLKQKFLDISLCRFIIQV